METRTLDFQPLTLADVEFAANALSRVQPRRPTVPARLLLIWQSMDRVHAVQRFAVHEGERRIGWTSVLRFGGALEEQAMISVVLPEASVRAYEATLAFGLRKARQMNAKAILCEPWESETALVEALRQGHWEQKRRQRFWRLELQPNADWLRRQRAAARERVATAGVRLATAADLGGEAIYPELYEINAAAHWDIPTTVPFEPDPYEVWLGWMAQPAVLPERVWVATVGGEPVGLSFLTYRPGLVDTGFTGVIREHRNLGIARALKLETLCQALDLGVDAVETDNDSENAPILHLNEQIGYREVEGQLQFLRPLD